MKISNSKQELARIISENGGWRDGSEFAAQDGDGAGSIDFFKSKPRYDKDDKYWKGECDLDERINRSDVTIKNFHQTILSREEYFHLYPAPDADGWIEWEGGECPVRFGELIDVRYRDGHVQLGCRAESRCDTELYATTHWGNSGGAADIIAYRLHKPGQAKPEFCESVMRSIPEPETKPSIEQLASDHRNLKDYAERKQKEADDAKADAEAKLAELVAAGEGIGLVLSVAAPEPELVITDWRDLRVGDVIELTGSVNPCWKEHSGSEMTVKEVFRDQGDNDDQVDLIGESGCWSLGGNTTWRFIRRP